MFERSNSIYIFLYEYLIVPAFCDKNNSFVVVPRSTGRNFFNKWMCDKCLLSQTDESACCTFVYRAMNLQFCVFFC